MYHNHTIVKFTGIEHGIFLILARFVHKTKSLIRFGL